MNINLFEKVQLKSKFGEYIAPMTTGEQVILKNGDILEEKLEELDCGLKYAVISIQKPGLDVFIPTVEIKEENE